MTNSNLPRVTQKIFGENAGQNIGQFGSAITGKPNPTGDISEIQALGSWGEGWAGAVLPTRDFPALEEMTGIQKVITQQLAYFFQKGFPEWDEDTTYFASTSFAQVNGVVYQSISDNNKGNNPTTSPDHWKIWDPAGFVGANVDLSNLSGTGENHFANPNLSNITDTAEQHIDTVAARPLSDNACTQENFPDEFEYWYDQKYTTFNKGYISTIGTPTMSEFGVISNCGDYDYFLTPSIDVTTADSWEMRFTYTPSGTTPTTAIGLFGSSWLTVSFTTANKITATVNYSGGSLTLTSSGTFATDDKIFCKISYNSTGYKLCASVNPFDYGTAATNSQTAKAASAQALKLGNVSATSYLSQGSIDMKYFEFDINGENVQNYKQTGIDTIIAPDYTVVGSPTISEDGIVSNFSANNYIKKEINGDGSTIKICNKFLYQTGLSNDVYTLGAPNGSPRLICASTLNFYYYDLSALVSMTYPVSNLTNGKWYFTEHYVSSSSQYAKIYDEDMNLVWEYERSVSINLDIQQALSIIKLGHYDSNAPFNSSIDLNAFKIYVDDELIYQPCLYIPYTETTDGTKIVDAAYYDRVQSCREQKGQALYLTLDEQNQAYYLPQGTVSGMISQNKQKIDELDTTLTADILQAMPVGASIAYEGTTAPDGWFAESGTEIQQSAYPLLYAVVGDKYNLETTQEGYFRLPDTNISSRFYEGSTTPGTLKDAGLPNITATGTGMGVGVISQVGGAAYNSGVNAERLTGGNQDGKRIDFNASRSSSVYGKSTTVQPKSITKFFIIKHD